MLIVSDRSQSLGKAPQVAADKYELDDIVEDALSGDLSSPLRSG